jgi:hypothetical protein
MFSSNVGIFILNGANASIKSIAVDSISFINQALFEFVRPAFPSPFIVLNNSFSNITRNENGGGVFCINISDSKIFVIERCEVFFFCFFFTYLLFIFIVFLMCECCSSYIWWSY